MAVDYYAYAVIGCEVTGQLHDRIRVRNCGCPPSDGKFCTHCGRQSNRTEPRPKPFYDEDNHRIGDLTVRFTTDDRRAFVGVATMAADSDTSGASVHQMSEAALTRAFDTVKATLEPWGLWDPLKFGLWAISRCSY